MSIIAVGGVSPKSNLKDIVKAVARPIHGIFEALNFGPSNKGRICYIRLSEKLDPLQVVERINAANISKQGSHLFAFIPEHVPDLAIANKPKKLPERLRRTLKIAPNLTRRQIIGISHEQIMKEMQTKYTELASLSAKTKHSLLRGIGQVVYDRIMEIMRSNKNIESCFILTKLYRKKHPHFADFQFILSTLHEIQDRQGKPRSQIQESELIKVRSPEQSDRVPYVKVTSILSKYIDKINMKIVDHIEKLKENMQPENDSMEEAARLKVREQLVNMGPYLPGITREVIHKSLLPTTRLSAHVVKIYGEPFLPNKEVLSPFVARYRGFGVMRSDYMYNFINVRVPREHLQAALAADGTLVGGAKLVIRPTTSVYYYKQHFSEFEKDSEFEEHKTNEYNARNARNADWGARW